MRLCLKLLFYLLAIAALCWLLPQIGASLNRATEAGSGAEASRGYVLFAVYLLVGTALALGVAWDFSRWLGDIAGSLFIGRGRLPGLTPVMWKADRLRAQGDPFGAIVVLRDHLASHPKQWLAAVRVAELYQDALADPLSAALEYEALLARRLPRSIRAEILLRLAGCRLVLRNIDESASVLREVIERFPGSRFSATAERRLMRLTAEPPARRYNRRR